MARKKGPGKRASKKTAKKKRLSVTKRPVHPGLKPPKGIVFQRGKTKKEE